MTKTDLTIDESLIISRLEQKELLDIKPKLNFENRFLSKATQISLVPFFSDLPANMSIDLQLIGEQIINASFNRGFFRYGTEENLAMLTPYEAVFALEHVKMSMPIFYQVAFITAYSSLIDPQKKLPKNLALALEFARVYHHFETLKNIFLCLTIDSAIDILNELYELIKPILKNFLRVYSLSDAPKITAKHEEIFLALSDASTLAAELLYFIDQNPDLLKPLAKKAIVSTSTAAAMGLTGPYLRANRNPTDLRHDELCLNRYENPPKLVMAEGGDALARFNVRLEEFSESLLWLKMQFYVKEEPSFLSPLIITEEFFTEPPKLPFAFGEIEGPEGEIKLGIFVHKNDNFFTYLLRTPAFFIAQSLPYLLSQARLSDLPLLLSSLGITPDEVDQ